jgi:hypothetical protein
MTTLRRWISKLAASRSKASLALLSRTLSHNTFESGKFLIVLLNVATHAAEALNEPPLIHKTRRALSISRRKQRHADPGRLHQRRLYCHVQ